jgi:hypothetical protein
MGEIAIQLSSAGEVGVYDVGMQSLIRWYVLVVQKKR